METLKAYINTKEVSRLLINFTRLLRNHKAVFHFLRVTLSKIGMKIHHGRFAILFSIKYEETCIYNT